LDLVRAGLKQMPNNHPPLFPLPLRECSNLETL
jgi:hypothetical protein